jgi:hypothetical protein
MLVMLKLADHASDDGICYPSQQYIADAIGVTRNRVNEIVKSLERDGVIEIHRTGRANRMTLYWDRFPSVTLQNVSKSVTEMHTDAESFTDVRSAYITESAPDVLPERHLMYADSTSDVRSQNTNHHRTVIEPSAVPNGTGGSAAAPPVDPPKQPSDRQLCIEHYLQRLPRLQNGQWDRQMASLKRMLDAGAQPSQINAELDRCIEASKVKGFVPCYTAIENAVVTKSYLHQHATPDEQFIPLDQRPCIEQTIHPDGTIERIELDGRRTFCNPAKLNFSFDDPSPFTNTQAGGAH